MHPLNKKDVGSWLALLARKIAYGENDIVCSGPIYKSISVKSNKLIIEFENDGGRLITKNGDELNCFTIAGGDQKFILARAIIDDDKVVVWNDLIDNPIAVRYAWADNPEGANLYNQEGLAASPFRAEI